MLPENLQHHDLLELLKAPMLLEPSPDVPVAKELPIDFEALMSPEDSLPQNKRLGKYVEQLLTQYMLQHSEVSNFKNNLVLSAKGKTLGELDMVFDFREERYHWEIAHKFYLLHQHHGQIAYYGPQGHDRLDLKVNKLLTHQLPLIQHEQLNHLRENQKEIINQLYVKGWIFYHLTQKISPPDFPRLNPDHSKGWWLFAHELEKALFEEKTCFQIVEKTRWLTATEVFKRFSEPLDLKSLSQAVKQHFKTEKRSLMVYSWTPDSALSSRGFIVPESWPDIP